MMTTFTANSIKDEFIKSSMESHKNQKTADDIEKIDNWNKHCESDYSARHLEVNELQKENQQLKDIIQIKLVQEKLLAGILECTLEELPLKIQSSKANTEIVEQLKQHIKDKNMSDKQLVEIFKEILKEKPQ